MAVTPQRATGTAELRPFTIGFAEAELEDLRARIVATRWPEKETVADGSQGVQLATTQALARYWATEYDWRRCEAQLNSYPNFLTEIDGLDIHFIHVRSQHAERPAAHRHARLAGLDHRAAEDHRAADQPHRPRRERVGRLRCGHPVDAGLRVLRQADRGRLGTRPHRAGVGRADAAPRLRAVRGDGRRLGRAHHRGDGVAGACRGWSASTPTWPSRSRRTFRRSLSPAGRRRRAVRRGAPRVRPAAVPLHEGHRRTSPDGRCARRRCTGSPTRPSPWPPGSSTTTRRATR